MEASKPIVILGAMPQETEHYRELLSGIEDLGGMMFKGSRNGRKVILGLTGIGSDDAAATTRHCIETYDPEMLIFTGVGGSLDSEIDMGDIAIVHAAVNYQTDMRAFGPIYVLGQRLFEQPIETRIARSDRSLIDLVDAYVTDHSSGGRFFVGYAATGDVFVVSDSPEVPSNLKHLTKQYFNEHLSPLLLEFVNGRETVPNICDMESEAVLRQANKYGVKAIVLRQISDTLDGDSVGEFNEVVLKEGIERCTPVVDYILNNV